MSKIVLVHGIGQQYLGAHTLLRTWYPAVCDGLKSANRPIIDLADVDLVFYGDIFRPQPNSKSGELLGVSMGQLSELDLNLITLWWEEAARLSTLARQNHSDESTTIQPPSFDSKAAAPATLQRALLQLSKSRFFAHWGGERILILSLHQVRKFLHEPITKRAILDKVAETIKSDTRVLVAHSLGSVIAYEALCAHPEWDIDTFITIGSPLGIYNLIFDFLTPSPKNGKGVWPGKIRQWVNVADEGDIVALNKKLAPLFGNVTDVMTSNGWKSHDAIHYLTSYAVGNAIGNALDS